MGLVGIAIGVVAAVLFVAYILAEDNRPVANLVTAGSMVGLVIAGMGAHGSRVDPRSGGNRMIAGGVVLLLPLLVFALPATLLLVTGGVRARRFARKHPTTTAGPPRTG